MNQESRMHKVVLIGAGRIGRIHAGNAARHPRLALAGIVDPVADVAAALAAEWGTTTTSVEAALAEPTTVSSGVGTLAPTEAMLMITPPTCAIIAGITARADGRS